MFVENMFDSRYGHVDELRRMGADIRVDGRVGGSHRGRKGSMEPPSEART